MIKPVSLPTEVISLLQDRHADEMNAFYAYRAMSNWCQNVGFFKAAAYYAAESQDELSHAKGIEEFLVNWNVTPVLPSIEIPSFTFTNLATTIEEAYKMEYDLYEKYEATSNRILSIGDTCVFDFLAKYRTIQTQSVAEQSDKINMLNGVNTDKFSMLLLEENLFG